MVIKKVKIKLGDTMDRWKNRIKNLRIDNDLTQVKVAEYLSVLRDTYSKWEHYINDIPLDKCNMLVNMYEKSFDYLLGLTDINIQKERKNIDLKLLCQRLFKLRKENHLTQEKLGNAVGFNQHTYSTYENGVRIPTTFKLLCFAIYYNISFDYLVGRSDNREIDLV